MPQTAQAASLAARLPQQHAEPRPTSAGRLRVSAATMRKVRAYNRYRARIARQKQRARTAIRFARDQIGKPYVWGATGPYSYDCSGLVMRAWERAGVDLPRVTWDQYRAVNRKVSLQRLRPGDLIFFNNRGHVGMYLKGDRFIHAPNRGARVRIDPLTARRVNRFAGAVRPGAPPPRWWSPTVVRTAHQLGDLGADDGYVRPAGDRPAPRRAHPHGHRADRPPVRRDLPHNGAQRPTPVRLDQLTNLPGFPRPVSATGAASGAVPASVPGAGRPAG
ncbi:C40 family peptidase [Actinomadura viridis]|uniref:C40 family peptidase n=1 Tax=Actinomadura viridis TaxID=58110 RepID=UPI00368A75BA